jgi:uncharacterized repeat protein (TIGR01451 family)
LLASYTVTEVADLPDKDLSDGQPQTVNGTVSLRAIWMQAEHDGISELNISFAGGLSIPSASASFSTYTVQMVGTGVTIGSALGFGANSRLEGITFNDPFGSDVSVGAGSMVTNCTFLGGTGLGTGANSQVLHCTVEGGLVIGSGSVATSTTIGKSGAGDLIMNNSSNAANVTVEGGVEMSNGSSLGAATVGGRITMVHNNTVVGSFIKNAVWITGNGNLFDNNIVQDGQLWIQGTTDGLSGNTISNNTFRRGQGIRLSGVVDSVIKNNRIFQSTSWGIQLSNDDPVTGAHLAGRNKIQGNVIGLDEAGGLAGNKLGIRINGSAEDLIGGPNAGDGNTIVGVGDTGILITSGKKYTVQGNYVGTNSALAPGMGNLFHGILIQDTTESIIGGASASAGNTVASNGTNSTHTGITVRGDMNVIQGNRIGRTRESDPASFGHGGHGLVVVGNENTIGGSASGAANIISGQRLLPTGSAGAGISLTGDRNRIMGNRIGTDAEGRAKLGNAGGGIFVNGKNNQIGGTTEAAGNIVAFNGFREGQETGPGGVSVIGPGGGVGSTGNMIRLNSIYGNRGRGIRLADFKKSLNDTGRYATDHGTRKVNRLPDEDAGANNLQNFPVLSSMTSSGGMIALRGSLQSEPNKSYTLDFYANDEPHRSGFGDGQTYLGSTTVSTGGDGLILFEVSFPSKGSGKFIAATATDNDGNTSTFSLVDSDLDGIADGWETHGIDIDEDGQIDLMLQGANPLRKTIYVEVDWMSGYPILTDEATGKTSVEIVRDAFRDAPVDNPDGSRGIDLIVDLDDDNLPPIILEGGSLGSDFRDLKRLNFGTADQRLSTKKLDSKTLVYHYCIVARNFTDGRGGMAELIGNDFVIVTAMREEKWAARRQAGTFMHELGHNLGLHHGGGGSDHYGSGDDTNFKPNYFSVMNYAWEKPGAFFEQFFVAYGKNLATAREAKDDMYQSVFYGVPLEDPALEMVMRHYASWEPTYSRSALPSLNEFALNELTGISGGPELAGKVGILTSPHFDFFFGVPGWQLKPQFYALTGAIDWNADGDTHDIIAIRDVNNLDHQIPTLDSMLKGHEDWSQLWFNFLDVGQGAYDALAGWANGGSDQIEINETYADPLAKILEGVEGADLAAAHLGTPGTAIAGRPLTLTAEVRNLGPGTANAVIVTSALAPQFAVASASTSQGTYLVEPSGVRFTVGSMAPGAVVTLTVTVTPIAVGPLTHTIIVSSATADGASANNQSVKVVEVQPRATGIATAQVVKQRVGRKTETVLVLTFDADVNAALAQNLEMYRLTTAGRDRKFNTPDDVVVALSSATYDAQKRTITLRTRKSLARTVTHELRVNGNSLRDSLGRLIDGDGDGLPGGDWRASIKGGVFKILRS